MHFEVVDCPVTLTSENRDELRLLYADLRDHYLRRDAANGTRTTLNFVWCIAPGLDPACFWATYADQRHTFAPSQPIMNSAQDGCAHAELHLLNHVIPTA
ncbi:hypothetical protein Lesp02_56670 [Lentzea sp. NBRC 105346]|uniref:hypothetical protein n=1 Tax=Lentzea sp. NBRC 105346 TaxID=3032205 RepID=UPI0024A1BFA6|nr:hypothetical protein [Lentzea sp. NBRC 105346]GLZ33479.1 hypothetical protein Lesp02_56670 [Lentzea sp. NBRC 105346]